MYHANEYMKSRIGIWCMQCLTSGPPSHFILCRGPSSSPNQLSESSEYAGTDEEDEEEEEESSEGEGVRRRGRKGASKGVPHAGKGTNKATPVVPSLKLTAGSTQQQRGQERGKGRLKATKVDAEEESEEEKRGVMDISKMPTLLHASSPSNWQ